MNNQLLPLLNQRNQMNGLHLLDGSSVKNDLIVDPASGGYSVFMACLGVNRNFLGCDLKCG